MQWGVKMLYLALLKFKDRVVEPEPPRNNMHRYYSKRASFFVIGDEAGSWKARHPWLIDDILDLNLNWWDNEQGCKYIRKLAKELEARKLAGLNK